MLLRDFRPTGTASDDMDRMYQLQNGPFIILRMRRKQLSTRRTRFAGLLVIFGFLIALMATGVHFVIPGPAPMLVAGVAMLAVVVALIWAKRALTTDASN